jgi:MinD-like ATPase involved in chromosome partitioning or flagellar assembly
LVTSGNDDEAPVRVLDSENYDEPHVVPRRASAPLLSRASSEPENLRITIDLPATVHSAPDDEVAVAIEEVPVNPGFVHGTGPITTSVTVMNVPIPSHNDANGGPAVPELPDAGPGFSRRDRLGGKVSLTPEPAAMLTADRLLAGGRRVRPGGRWPRFVYGASFHLINIGDSQKVRDAKAVDVRIAKVFEGGTRFVPVLTRKGGVGKTTVTTLLGMALADVRDDRVIAVDANPDRGTLAERVNKQTRATVRDVVTKAASIGGFTDFTTLVSRDETRLDILASDTDPLLSEAFDENDYNVVADLTARFYSIVLTDCGTGIVHSVMRATLQRADSVVIVSGGSVDEARLASETLTWLEANGYGELVRNAIVALNTATQGTNMVKLEEIEAHFRSRVREVVRIPYDPQLAAGSVVSYKDLKPLTQNAARELAALVVDGLPARREL